MNSLVSSKSLAQHSLELLLKKMPSLFLDIGPAAAHTGGTVVNLFF